MKCDYLAVDEIIEVNKIVTSLSGGSHGLRDGGLLESITLKPQTSFSGDELYPDLFLKSAVFFEAIVNYQVFVDGNKRTGFASMAMFLHRNGFELGVDDKEIVTLCLKTAKKEMDLAEIAGWIKSHISRA